MSDNSSSKCYRLQPHELKNTCDPEFYGFATTEEESPQEGIIGQERALRSVEFGLEVNNPGYNIFMAGPPGTGKSTYAKAALQSKAKQEEPPSDWLYLYNFTDPEQPQAVSLPAGWGETFRNDMEELVEDARTAITHEFDSGNFEKQRAEIIEKYQTKTTETLQNLEEEVREQGFALQRGAGGFTTVPLNDAGNPMQQEEYQALPEERRREIDEKGNEIQRRIRRSIRQVRQNEQEAKSAIRDLEKRMGSFAIRPLFEQLKEKYADFPQICSYLDEVHEDIISNLDEFKEGSDDETSRQLALIQGTGGSSSDTDRYEVNLLVNNSDTEGAPVIEEANPIYYNLLGKVEYESRMGTLTTDHTLIRPGALHKANGGYLILRAEDVLRDPLCWDALKRTLKDSCIRIENIGEQFRLVPTTAIQPDSIPLEVKIVLMGSPLIYYLLSTYDDDFGKYFKIKADFDVQMQRSDEHLQEYAKFIRSVQKREDLLPYDRSAVARICDYSSRLAGDQTKLSSRFNEVVEIVYEADGWARLQEADCVTVDHVAKAIEEKMYRSNLVESHIREAIERGKLLVDTDGSVAGQINALQVTALGDYSFGAPVRITANVHLGNEGVVNVEREVKMSGSIHSKGVMILAGYLADQFAYDKPLSLSASITFEQTYGGVEGDSASVAELVALLSALADVPVKQSVAVTGSVNQKGLLQPVGGVNEKIEGFYLTCKAAGLTGEQGVLIPEQNADNLMLKDEVIQAVETGDFHVWTARTAKQAVELLTAIPAGERKPGEQFPKDTVFGRADRQLRQMAAALRDFTQHSDDTEHDE